jgi:RHS repeat-associated protein
VVYDQLGNAIWQRDANGAISYTAYDLTTGAVTMSIQDVSSAQLGNNGVPGSLPTGWSIAGGTHLDLVTTYEVDTLGRTVEETDPNLDVTFTVYDDPLHEVRMYSGWMWNPSTSTFYIPSGETLPPTEVEIDDLPVSTSQSPDGYAGTYSEFFAMSATPSSSTTGGVTLPVGGETIGNITALSISIMNEAGQDVQDESYFNLPSLGGDISGTGSSSVLAALGAGSAWNKSTGSGNYYVTTTQYNDQGEVDKMVDADGNITRIVYDDLGRETSEWVGTNDTPTSGYWSPTNNTGTSNMVEISAEVYDNGGVGDGNLTESISFPLPPAGEGEGEGAAASTFRVTEMLYDWQDRMIATKSGALVTEVSSGTSGAFGIDGLSDWLELDPSGETSDGVNRPIVYDTLDNLGETTTEYVYAGNGISLSDIDDGGVPSAAYASDLQAETTFVYDAQWRTSETDVHSVDQSTGAVDSGVSAEVSTMLYDADGNVTSMTDPLGNVTEYVYDGADRETEQIDAQIYDSLAASKVNPTTVMVYDNDGNVVSVEDPNGNYTTYAYDAASRETSELDPNPTDGSSSGGPLTTYSYDAAANLSSATDPLNQTTSFDYDALGRQTEVIQPTIYDTLTAGYVNPTTVTAYDGDSNVLSTTDPNGNTTSYEYDDLSDMIQVTQPSPDGIAAQPVTYFAYDDLGDELSMTDPMSRETTYEYNALGQQVLETDPSPGVGQTSPATTTTYDALGNVITQADALGDTTTNAYDGFGQLSSQTDPDGNVTSFSYDADNNQLSETDADGNTTAYAYDALNRLSSQSEIVALYLSGGTPVTTTATTAYGYDADGNLTQTTDADGQVIQDTYDHLNRETEEDWFPNATDAASDTGQTNTIDYTYYANSQLHTASDDSSSYTYTFDADGHVASVDNNGSGASGTTGTTGVPDVVLTFGYDAAGNQTAMSATIGGTQDSLNTYSYDTLNREVSVSQQGQTGGNAVADKLVDFGLDAAGDLSSVDRYSDLAGTSLVASSAYGYDGDARLTSLTHTAGDGTTTYADYVWTYDAASRVKSLTNSANIADYSAENIGDYEYDADGQLLSAAPPSGVTSDSTNSLSNSYDDNGNATSLNGATTITGAGNRLLSDGTWNYTLDANGNLLSQVGITGGAQAGNEVDYVYDIRNRVASVTNKSSGVITQVVTYTYDAFGDLIGRTYTPYTSGVAGTTTTNRIVYDPATGQKILTFDGAGNLTTRVLNGAAVDQILATETVTSLASAGAVEWLLPNNEGTIDDIVNSSDTLEDHLTYNAFGQLTGQAGPTTYGATDMILGEYTGSFFDSATGLSYHNDPRSGGNGRWYNADLQRWLAQDPIGLVPGTNPYAYVLNGPTDATDPSGLQEQRDNDDTLFRIFGDDGKIIQDGKPKEKEVAGAYGNWSVLAWRARYKAPEIQLHSGMLKTFYGGDIDVAYTPNKSAIADFAKQKYEISVFDKFELDGERKKGISNRVIDDDKAQGFEPYDSRSEDDSMAGVVGGNPRNAAASRFPATITDADIQLIFAVECLDAHKWIDAMQITVRVNNIGDDTYVKIFDPVRLDISKIAPVINAARAEPKARVTPFDPE